MNYIGSKYTLLPFIEQVFRQITDGSEKTVCDIFAGTGAVGRLFKKLGLQSPGQRFSVLRLRAQQSIHRDQ